MARKEGFSTQTGEETTREGFDSRVPIPAPKAKSKDDGKRAAYKKSLRDYDPPPQVRPVQVNGVSYHPDLIGWQPEFPAVLKTECDEVLVMKKVDDFPSETIPCPCGRPECLFFEWIGG